MPLDGFGREVDYLRISLTERCNLSCAYCMPAFGVLADSAEDLLTPADIGTVVRAAAAIGFRKIRLTGGEPTLRSDLVEIVRRLTAIDAVEDLGLTTNGLLLPNLAHELRRAGLKRINIHLDTLHAAELPRLMRGNSYEGSWAGVQAAVAAGFNPIKINCVVARGSSDAGVVDLARLTLEHNWHVRFIEMMPMGGGECEQFARNHFVSAAEVRARIETALGRIEPAQPRDATEECRNYSLPGARGVIGFISPVSEPFCRTCSRLRLTADGKLRSCLLRNGEMDVTPALQDPAALEELLRAALARKPAGHQLHGCAGSALTRGMVRVGG